MPLWGIKILNCEIKIDLVNRFVSYRLLNIKELMKIQIDISFSRKMATELLSKVASIEANQSKDQPEM